MMHERVECQPLKMVKHSQRIRRLLQFHAYLVTFTEEILNRKHFLRNDLIKSYGSERVLETTF